MKLGRISPLLFIAVATIAWTVRLTAQNNDLDRQLLNAVESADASSVGQLLDRGANIESRKHDGSTPLLLAADQGNVFLVKMLLERGANASAYDDGGTSPLEPAARNGYTEIVELLLQTSLDQKQKNQALFAAADGGPVAIQMEDSSQRPNHPRDAVPIAKWESWLRTVRLLLDHGAYIEARDPERNTPLLWAASHGQTDIFRYLLERGADIQVRDKFGNTPLIAAACECALATMNSTYDIVKMLLIKGANPNAHAHDGTTALMNAAGGFGGSAIVELLLENGADPAAKDSKGNTALAIAKKAGRADKVQILKRAIGHAH